MDFVIKVLAVLILVFLNGFFVASEFALVGVRRTRIQELANRGNKAAKLVLQSLDNLETYISATQLGITLASLALGWIGEPAIAYFVEPVFLQILPKEAAFISAHGFAVILAFVFITFLHIVLGELAPKSIALQRAEKTSLFVIRPLRWFTSIFGPVIAVLNRAGITVVKIFGISQPTSHHLLHSEDEIKMILEQSGQGGIIEKGEVEMVHNVFRLGDIPVKQLMIPRTGIVGFEMNVTVQDLIKKIKRHTHSRYPIFDKTIDTIIGFVHVKDIYKVLLLDKHDKSLRDSGIVREVIHVPETKKADDVLLDMRKKRVHIAVVNDEYGGTAGLITLEDIIERLVGEIADEFDRPPKSIQPQNDGTVLIDGMTSVDLVIRRFHLPIKGQGYTTIGGLFFGFLGREPHQGDNIQIGDIILSAEEVSGNRITTIRLKKTKRKRS